MTETLTVPCDRRADWVGVICSLGCGIHCAAMPILLTALPSLTAVQWMADPLFHQVVAGICCAMVVLAIGPAWRLHRSWWVLGLATAGMGLLCTAAFVLPDQCCAQSQPTHAMNSHAFCRDCDTCNAKNATIGKPCFTAEQLEARLGPLAAQSLVRWQPYLSPLGGVMLILAHLTNLRRKRCACH